MLYRTIKIRITFAEMRSEQASVPSFLPAGPNIESGEANPKRYTVESDTFVTAFYGVYDPSRRELTYASAGHNPPRLKRCVDGTLGLLDGAAALPLGIVPNQTYSEQTYRLLPGD